MALFFCSTKYFRCLRNISKCIQIINSNKNCLCSAHDELVLKERLVDFIIMLNNFSVLYLLIYIYIYMLPF